MTGSQGHPIACLVFLVALSACTTSDGSTATVASTTTSTTPTTTHPPTTSTSAAVTTTSAAATTTPAPSASDLALVAAFIEFARSTTDETFAELSLADAVTLGLGIQTLSSVRAEDLRQPESWVFDVDLFRAYTGPFSALTLLESLGPHQVQVGEHPHCAGPPQPSPLGFEDYKRVSVQPTGMDSCLNWFTIDFFVASDNEVEAITLDLWEP